MGSARVVLIGGTPNVGKSTVAQAPADRLGFEWLSTDGLARHPGRRWRTPEREVPPHVAEHYGTLTVDELITSVLDHYERLWPRIEELITKSAAEPGARRRRCRPARHGVGRCGARRGRGADAVGQ